MSSRSVFNVIFLAALVVAALTTPILSHARNTKLLFPINEVLKSPQGKQNIASDIIFQFGRSASTESGNTNVTGEDVTVRAVSAPPQSKHYDRELSDKRTCREAFRMALSELGDKARAKNKNAIVNIISNYGGIEMSSPSEYECHSGYTRSVIELKGKIAQVDPRADASEGAQKKEENTTPKSTQSSPVMHSNTGEIIDTALLPYVNENMVSGYQAFLNRPIPRAFAVSMNGRWRSAWGELKDDKSSPKERVVRDCEKHSGNRCFLYAVDNTVVFKQASSDDVINNTNLLPNSSEKMVERYRYFLTRPLPRAFAISEGGEWWMAWGTMADNPAIPSERALQDCEKKYAKRCFIYAVDDTVIYKSASN